MTQMQIGTKLPMASFMTMTAEGPMPRDTDAVFSGRKVALFAVPGAFTPTCHQNHLPSYLAQMETLMAKGVDAIACISVNDVFVMDAWAQETGAKGKIEMLADGAGDFTKAVGMGLDLTAHGLGLRSKRYAALINDGVVEVLLIEENPGEAVSSHADSLLNAL